MKKISICGVKIDNLSFDQTMQKCIDMISDPSPNSLFTPNTDFIVKAIKNKEFMYILNKADCLVADGKPLIWASHFLKTPLKQKISGSSLFFSICEYAEKNGKSLFLLGSSKGIPDLAKENLKKKYPNIRIVGVISPSFSFVNNHSEIEETIKKIIDSSPDILIVGLGAPKQEYFITNYKDKYNVPLSLGLGASIDFAASVKKMPPQWIKNSGFGWLWRLIDEPKRLWRRYLIDDMKFFYYVYKEILKKK